MNKYHCNYDIYNIPGMIFISLGYTMKIFVNVYNQRYILYYIVERDSFRRVSGRIARNSEETEPFYKISTTEN